MQIELPQERSNSLGYKLRWFSLGPITGLVVLMITAVILFSSYQTQHQDAIYTGVSVSDIDLSGLSLAEAEQKLQTQISSAAQPRITLLDSTTGQAWEYGSADLGVQLDVDATVANAYQIGREGSLSQRLTDQFDSWYYGYKTSPVMIFDEGKLQGVIERLSSEIGQVPLDAAIEIKGDEVTFSASQVGRSLDKADTYSRLLAPLSNLQSAEVELLIHQSKPRVYDASAAAGSLRNTLSGPMEFYLQTPIDGVDLDRITVTVENLREWLRVSLTQNEDGRNEYNIFIDEVALRGWLEQYAQQIAREPERARFYFDDPTQQLVLVEPHVNGRRLDVEATIAQFNAQVTTPNRSVPFVIEEIVPEVNSNATAEQLGITELVAERTTWFFGSSDERKHNIARSASNFYGIVVAPGEEFSFNKYLGDISEEDGYKPALIIYGGQTIEGLGGGVCQVSTTLFQTVFWGGFDVGARTPHAYQVGYYEDGEGTGMDATVFNPLVDFTFTNNTEHYLLIENYYNEIYESLTFKIYSTDIGRRVEKTLSYDNVRPALTDQWQFNEELGYGEIEQVDWAAEGATVTVERTVYNFQEEVRDQDIFVSNYIPWGNVYQYGAGVDPNNLPRDWRDKIDENHGFLNIFEDF